MLEEEAFELAIWKKRISGAIPKLLRYESEINNRQKGTDKLRGFVDEQLGLSSLPRCRQRFAPSVAEALEVSQ